MNIFVLGSTGMLGNYISSYMKQQVEVDTDQTYDVISFSREHIDASDVEGYRFLRSLFKRNGLKEGDFVIMRSYSGTRFKVHGKEFRLINDDSVEAVVEDPRGVMKV